MHVAILAFDHATNSFGHFVWEFQKKMEFSVRKPHGERICSFDIFFFFKAQSKKPSMNSSVLLCALKVVANNVYECLISSIIKISYGSNSS